LKKFRRVLSLFLVVTLIISLIPDWLSKDEKYVQAEEKIGGNKVRKGAFEVGDLRTEKSQTFVNDDGTLTSKIYETPIHYKENEKWVPINNKLVETPDSSIVKNKANRFKVKFEKNNLNNKIVNLSIENSSFSMTPVKNEDNVPRTIMKQQQQSLTEIEENEISYNDIYPSVDLNYSIGNQKVKEDIVLQEKPLDSTPTKFSFKLNITNLAYEKQEDGSILFKDLNNQPLFYIDRPYMFDSFVPSGYQKQPNITSIPEEALSYDVVMNIVERDDELFIDIVPNRDWLMDSKRVYPVVIDPTIVMIQPKTEGIDTTIRSSHPTVTGGGETDTTVGLQKGADGFTKVLRSLYKFDLSSIPAGASILNADLNLWMSSVSNDTSIQVDAHELSKSWTENGATWNSTGTTSWTNTGGDYTSTPIDSVSGIGNLLDLSNNLKWDVTSSVKKWSGTPSSNYGLLLKSSNETTDSYKKFISSDTSSTEYAPMLAVTYYSGSRLGLENYWTFDKHNLTNDTSYVNITTGNHVLQATDITVPGRGGMDINFTRTYNYKDFEDSPLGYGWTYPGNERIIQNWEDNRVLYADSDGTRHIFTYDATTQIYKAPPGTYLNLKYANGDFTLTDKFGQKKVFKGSEDVYQDLTIGRISYLEDLHGNRISYNYDTAGKLINITDPSGRQVTLNYYTSGRISQITDFTGRKTLYGYDVNGNLTTVDQYSDSTNYTRTTYVYNSNNNLLTVIDPKGRKTDFTFNGAITKVQLPYGEGASADLPDRPGSTYTIDINNYVASSTDRDGNKTNYSFNSNYILTKITDALGQSTEYILDDNYNALQEKDPNGNITVNTFDLKGNMISSKDPEGNITYWTYNSNSKVTSEKDPSSNLTTYQYNTYEDLLSITKPDGTKISYTYDSYGNSLTTTDENGNVTKLQYDTNGNFLTGVTDPLQNQVSFQYNDTGKMTSKTDAKGQKTTYEYDGSGLLSKVIDANLGETRYSYDAAANKTSITNAKGNISKYEYNEQNNVTKVINPLNQTTTLEYDVNGNQTKIIMPKGDHISYSYDAANRLIGKYTNDIKKWGFDYDSSGNITSVTDSNNQVTNFTYDQNNRVKQKSSGSNKIDYIYDPNGNITSINGTAGTNAFSTQYTYTVLNQMKTVSVNGVQKANYSYDDQGKIISLNLANGTYSNTSYTDANELSTLKNYKSDGTLLHDYTYTYDKNGLPKSIQTKNETLFYEYDSLNQLTKEILVDGTSIQYEYDSVGNRTKKIKTVGSSSTDTTYTYDSSDQLINVNGLAFTYDKNGNLTSDGEKNYEYNEENQLIEVKNKTGTSIARYTYDHEGKRTSIITSSGSTYFHYNGDKIVYETNANNAITAEYTWDAQGNPVTMTKSGETYYYHINGHGDVTTLTNSSGVVVAEYNYDAWGNILSETGAMAASNPFRYAGYRYDQETGLYYLKTRYYDSNLGRFITKDLFHGFEDDPLSLNRYTYVKNNPVINIDPDGLYSKKVHWWGIEYRFNKKETEKIIHYAEGTVAAGTVYAALSGAVSWAVVVSLGGFGVWYLKDLDRRGASGIGLKVKWFFGPILGVYK
jgi:RHS repeat-associated protein